VSELPFLIWPSPNLTRIRIGEKVTEYYAEGEKKVKGGISKGGEKKEGKALSLTGLSVSGGQKEP